MPLALPASLNNKGMSPRTIRIAQCSTVLLLAVALKLYYSTTNVNGLRWILAPPTFLVELITGASFTFESNAGYMSSDHTFLIAASCSGVNFLIAAFLMLSLGKLWRCHGQNINWRYFAAAALIAYLTTVVANTVRISTALLLRRSNPEMIWINPDQLHRFEGIFIYFGFLLLLFILSDRLGADDRSRSKSASVWRYLLPLTIYYATTLAIPLANAAVLSGTVAAGFWAHSLTVFLIPMFLILPVAVLQYFKTTGAVSVSLASVRQDANLRN